jgi:hypothetical protein
LLTKNQYAFIPKEWLYTSRMFLHNILYKIYFLSIKIKELDNMYRNFSNPQNVQGTNANRCSPPTAWEPEEPEVRNINEANEANDNTFTITIDQSASATGGTGGEGGDGGDAELGTDLQSDFLGEKQTVTRKSRSKENDENGTTVSGGDGGDGGDANATAVNVAVVIINNGGGYAPGSSYNLKTNKGTVEIKVDDNGETTVNGVKMQEQELNNGGSVLVFKN